MNNITAGVDTKENHSLTLHKHMMDFSTMGKVCTGVDDDHLDTFNSRLNNMVMDVGEHLRGRPQLMKKIKL